ncbi:MAG: NAD(P)/FAD-dependent oxidoreductase [Armatimonadetes bacterium]|nr:NAD(P)/FAD-dependent oxidoreductase [Armatimonadota bacterium]
MSEVDITIIGGGPVGLFASFYAGLRGMSVRIIDSLPELGGQLTALYPEKYIYDMPGFPKVLARDLAQSFIEQGMQFGAEAVLGSQAVALEKAGEGYVIENARGERMPTRTVIIAAGAGAFSPTKIGVQREEEFEGKGLHYGVRSKDEFKGKRIGIVGGGDSALDWCLNLHPIVDRIALIHRRDQFRAHEDSVKQAMALDMDTHLWSTVTELHGDERLEAVTLENSQTKELLKVDLDALIVNIGFRASLGPLKDWGLEIEKNQIKVNERFETNLPAVFAVGDVCSFPGKLKLIATGVGEAATAVCFAKTHLDPEAKHFPGHSSDMELPSAAH